MTNIKTGSDAEVFITKEFAKIDAFATILSAGITGQQPFDILAISKNYVYALDVKHCKGNYFPFTRVEENQKQALSYIDEKINNKVLITGFALVHKGLPYFLSYQDYKQLDQEEVKSVKPKEQISLYKVGDFIDRKDRWVV